MLSILLALASCSSNPTALPPVTISASAARVGNPWFLTYTPTVSVTGGSGDAVVWIGHRTAPAQGPWGCVLEVSPCVLVPHWFPLRGNYVVASMPDLPADPALVGVRYSVQSWIVCHLPAEDVLLGTNAVDVVVGA